MRVGISLALAGLGLVGTAVGCGGQAPHRSATSDAPFGTDTLVGADAASAEDADSTTFTVPAGSGFLTAGPGWARAARHRTANRVQPPIVPPSCPEGPTVHFDTPQAAMTYLASAWNRDDLAELCQVTNPNARFLLNDMHREAVNLRLAHCDKVDVGHYSCTFRHDYPAHMHRTGTGKTWLDVAPADNPGWYMAVFEGCG